MPYNTYVHQLYSFPFPFLAHVFMNTIHTLVLYPHTFIDTNMNRYAALIDQNIFIVPEFTLESGKVLRQVPVAYKTWGKLNQPRDNVMVICHAFTGSSDVEDW